MYGKYVRTRAPSNISRSQCANYMCPRARMHAHFLHRTPKRRTVASFEYSVDQASGRYTFHVRAIRCAMPKRGRRSPFGHDARRALGAAACSQPMATRPRCRCHRCRTVSARARAIGANEFATPRARDEQRSACLTVQRRARGSDTHTPYTVHNTPHRVQHIYANQPRPRALRSARSYIIHV